jgi:hypothetical protein
MAIQDVRETDDLAMAEAFLARHGIVPDATGAVPVGEVVDAIRARGWNVTVDGGPGDWSVEIGEEESPMDFRYVAASDPDRTTALLRALAAALTWIDPDGARRAFDREARDRLGISGEEFLRRWDAGEFEHMDADFPPSAVARLVTLMPFARRGT